MATQKRLRQKPFRFKIIRYFQDTIHFIFNALSDVMELINFEAILSVGEFIVLKW